MTPSEKLEVLRQFNASPPAGAAEIELAGTSLGFILPTDYRDFLMGCDGGDGYIGETYLILWGVGELADLNRSYQVSEYAPGLVLFGSDGGGEGFGYDSRRDPPPVVSVPFVGMDRSLIREVAPSFENFLLSLASGWSG